MTTTFPVDYHVPDFVPQKEVPSVRPAATGDAAIDPALKERTDAARGRLASTPGSPFKKFDATLVVDHGSAVPPAILAVGSSLYRSHSSKNQPANPLAHVPIMRQQSSPFDYDDYDPTTEGAEGGASPMRQTSATDPAAVPSPDAAGPQGSPDAGKAARSRALTCADKREMHGAEAATSAAAPGDSLLKMKQANYNGLGEYKHLEDLYQRHGTSPTAAFAILTEQLATPLSTGLYCQVHQLLFSSDGSIELRSEGSVTYCQTPFREAHTTKEGVYVPGGPFSAEEGVRQFGELKYGDIHRWNAKHSIYALHHGMPTPFLKLRLNDLIDAYHVNIRRAVTNDQRLRAIAVFFQQCEWLQPFRDTTRRTNLALLNYLLAQNGFHPTIMKHQYEFINGEMVSTLNILDVDCLVASIKAGFLTWEAQAKALDEWKKEQEKWAAAGSSASVGEADPVP